MFDTIGPVHISCFEDGTQAARVIVFWSTNAPWICPTKALLPDRVTFAEKSPSSDQRRRTRCRLIREASSQRDSCQRQYYLYFHGKAAVLDSLHLAPSLDHFIWAMSLVRSRSFGTQVGAEGITVMAPFLDLANCSLDHVGSFRAAKDRRELASVICVHEPAKLYSGGVVSSASTLGVI